MPFREVRMGDTIFYVNNEDRVVGYTVDHSKFPIPLSRVINVFRPIHEKRAASPPIVNSGGCRGCNEEVRE